MSRLIETIKVERREFFDLSYHTARMNRARLELFGCGDLLDLEKCLPLPTDLEDYRYKCRVVYSECIHRVDYERYELKPVRSLKIVDGSGIDYRYKYADRNALLLLREQRAGCDEILITSDGRITDTSYANIALFDGACWYTPDTVLLEGTKRARLIDEGVLKTADIRAGDVFSFLKLSMINALIDLGECVIQTSSIVF